MGEGGPNKKKEEVKEAEMAEPETLALPNLGCSSESPGEPKTFNPRGRNTGGLACILGSVDLGEGAINSDVAEASCSGPKPHPTSYSAPDT